MRLKLQILKARLYLLPGKIKAFVKKQIFDLQLRFAVNQAKSYAKLFDSRYLVVTIYGRPQAVSKQRLKELVKRRTFKKGTTISDIEKRAYYISK